MADVDVSDLRDTVWIITEVLGSCVLILFVLVLILLYHVKGLQSRVSLLDDPAMTQDKHAFRDPAIQPDEELAKRGYAQYGGSTDSIVYAQDSPDYSSIGRSQATLYPSNKY